jgi:hypothetical protein
MTRKLISSTGITVLTEEKPSPLTEQSEVQVDSPVNNLLTIRDPNQNSSGYNSSSSQTTKTGNAATASSLTATVSTCDDSSSSPSPFHSSSNELDKITTASASSATSSSSSMLSSGGGLSSRQLQKTTHHHHPVIANADFIDSGAVVIAAANAANFKRTSRTKLHKAPCGGTFNPVENSSNSTSEAVMVHHFGSPTQPGGRKFLSSASSTSSSASSSYGFYKTRVHQATVHLKNGNTNTNDDLYNNIQSEKNISVEQLRRKFSNLEKQHHTAYVQNHQQQAQQQQQQQKSNSSSLLMMIQNQPQSRSHHASVVPANETIITENKFYSTKSIKSLSSLNPVLAQQQQLYQHGEKVVTASARRSDVHSSSVFTSTVRASPPVLVVANQFYESTSLNAYGEQETLV